MKHRNGPRAHARGFTLVELMVVVVVLGLVAVLAAPSFTRTLANRHVKGAAEEAYADLQYARSEAVQRNAEVILAFNAAGWRITAAPGGTLLKDVALSGGATLAAGSGTSITFNPVRATATVNGDAAAFAHLATNATLRVNVNTLGRVALCTPGGTMTGFATC